MAFAFFLVCSIVCPFIVFLCLLIEPLFFLDHFLFFPSNPWDVLVSFYLLGMFFSSDSKSFVLNVFHRMLTLIPSLVMVSMLLLRLDRSLCIAVQSAFL